MNITDLGQKFPHFVALTRLNRPIGIYLLLWPMLWALWFAAKGVPRIDVLLIFIVGTILTRSAGCAINDYADRDFDAHVARTQDRPLATGALSSREALGAAGILMLLALLLVLQTNKLTVLLSFVALLLAVIYPFAKRYTHLPQVILGAAFGFCSTHGLCRTNKHTTRTCLVVVPECYFVGDGLRYALCHRRQARRHQDRHQVISYIIWAI